MKKLVILILPLLLVLLAFRPVNSFTVTGKVTDETGAPMIGVFVQLKGTNKASATNQDGIYSIIVNSTKDVLIFSSVGYEKKEVKIKGRTSVNVEMKPLLLLSEVVVTRTNKISAGNARLMRMPKTANMPQGYVDLNRGYQGGGFDEDEMDREGYAPIVENAFRKTGDAPLSTFSIDVDAAAYSNMRRFIEQDKLPPAGAIRLEEMVNYFRYNYPQPTASHPFSVTTEIGDAPWNKTHKLLLIGLQGKTIPAGNLPPSNLVFLIDVSGSMQGPNRLGLVKSSMKLLVDQLREEDKVSIVVYAGAAGLVLPPTSGFQKTKIKDAIDNLQAGGSTAGGAGIRLAYKTARENFRKDGNNRVILCTDGDFNMGESSDDAMVRLVEEERKSGVFLTVLGYGMGNYQDAKMQLLADKGNGNHAYIDGLSEAKKVLVNEFGGTLFTIAKDVKLQVEFNPAMVAGYRLIGYENRLLANEDFNDDQKDAGEMGSGHTVTALYEIIPAGVSSEFLRKVDTLKYQSPLQPLSPASHSGEWVTVKFRYKQPDGDKSILFEQAVPGNTATGGPGSDNFRFASAVTEMGLLLRNSEYKQSADWDNLIARATSARGRDEEGYRAEFIRLATNAKRLAALQKKEE